MFQLIKKPKIPLFFAGIILILGMLSSFIIPKESTPYIEYGIVTISTSYPGAGAKDIDQNITQKIEEKITSVSGIDTITSVSIDGFSRITIELKTNANISAVVSDLRSAVDEAKADLPSDLDNDPRVSELDSTKDRPFLKLALRSKNNTRTDVELSQIATNFQKKIEKISGVEDVKIEGEVEPEIKILLNKNKLESLNISYFQVFNAIKSSEKNTPLGNFTQNKKEYSLRFHGESKNLNDIRNIIVGKIGTGTSSIAIRLKDIAKISLEAKKDMPITRFYNSKIPEKIFHSSILKISRSAGGDVFKTEKKVKNLTQKYFSAPKFSDIEYTFYAQSTRQMKKDYQNLVSSFFFSLIIVLISIFFFIGVKEGIVASTVIPLSFAGTIFVLFLMGKTLNIMTNFGMILALGILVDTAIVMVEGTTLYIKKGLAPKEAALQSFLEFRAPLFSGMLTTLIVFLPLFFLPGVIGKFLSFIPITVTIVLIISLFVSLYIIPPLAGIILKQKESISPVREKIETKTKHIISSYIKVLKKILTSQKLKLSIFGGTLFLFIASLFLPIKFEMFPTADSDYITIKLSLPVGDESSVTSEEISKVEKFLIHIPEIEVFKTQVIKNEANLYLELIPFKERQKLGMRTSVELKEVIQEKFSNSFPKKSSFQVQEAKKGPPQKFPVGFRVKIEDISQIKDGKRITQKITQLLKSIEGTQGVSNSISEIPGEYRFILDREKAFLKGINPENIPNTIRGSVYGTVVSSFKNNGEDIDIRLQYDPSNIPTIEDILSIKIKNDIPLSDVVNIEKKSALSEITRYQGDLVFTISAFLKKDANAQEITNKANSIIQNKIQSGEFKIPEGISIDDASENKENENLINTMKIAFVMAILFMFFILVVQFESYSPPLLVLQTVIFAQIGVSIGLYITGTEKSLSYMLGLISLAGIVVNDAIILVDKIRKNIYSGKFKNKLESILNAGETRFVPVILTTLTTSAGIFPLIFIDSFWSGLAYTIIFGLSISSLLTLFLIPIGYVLFKKPEKILKE